jgi:hypothetical protein
MRQQSGDRLGVAFSQTNLGRLAELQGNYEQARSFYKSSLMISRELGDRIGIASSLLNMGNVTVHNRDHARARSLYLNSLGISCALGHREFIAETFESFAALAVVESRASTALTLAGAAARLREAIGSALPVLEQELLQQRLQPAWDELSDKEGAAAWALGQSMRVEEVVHRYISAEPLPLIGEALPEPLPSHTNRNSA